MHLNDEKKPDGFKLLRFDCSIGRLVNRFIMILCEFFTVSFLPLFNLNPTLRLNE